MVMSGISYWMNAYLVKYVGALYVCVCTYSQFDLFTFSNYKGVITTQVQGLIL